MEAISRGWESGLLKVEFDLWILETVVSKRPLRWKISCLWYNKNMGSKHAHFTLVLQGGIHRIKLELLLFNIFYINPGKWKIKILNFEKMFFPSPCIPPFFHCIIHKLHIFIFKALNGLSPPYLSALIHYQDVDSHPVLPMVLVFIAHLLHFQTKHLCDFSRAPTQEWEELTGNISKATSLPSFKSLLQVILCHDAFRKLDND